MAADATAAIFAAGGMIIGGLITSVIGSRSSESAQLRAEIIELRKVIDRRHTHLSAYARTLEVVLLAWQLPSQKEQIETIQRARESLKHALGSPGGPPGGR
jgi:hypothetical protein